MARIKAPVVQNPELLDRIIGAIQRGLVENIGWLDVAFGRAERLVKMSPNGRRIYTPNVYAGGNEYTEVTPDANIGNFSFFWVDDPQRVDIVRNVSISIDATFSLIVWFDFRKVLDEGRNKEQVKRELLDVLNGGFRLPEGRITINKVYELAENIYRGFTLDEIDNQFLMHPYGGFRFEGELQITETCLMK